MVVKNNVHNFVKFFFYITSLDRLIRLISFDVYSIKNRLIGKKLNKNYLYDISNLPKNYKEQVYLVAATIDYIENFMPSLLKQLIETDSLRNTELIVGIITNREIKWSAQKKLQQDFPDVKFVIVKSNFFEISSTKNCARFFLAKKVLQDSENTSLLITDIDVQINQNLDSIFFKYKDWNAVKLRRGRDIRFYCYAGCVLLSAKNRLVVINDLCDRISVRFLSRNWYTDQIALWFTFKKFKGYFKELTEEVFSIKYNNSTVFAWKGKNKYTTKSLDKVSK